MDLRPEAIILVLGVFKCCVNNNFNFWKAFIFSNSTAVDGK